MSLPTGCTGAFALGIQPTTAEQCACFFAFVGSGIEIGNPDTFAPAFNDDTRLIFPQSGVYEGLDGISEYLSFVLGGVFVSDYIDLTGSGPFPLSVVAPSPGQCVFTTMESRRLPFNPEFTEDNLEVCIDTVVGQSYTYALTGLPDPILVQQIYTWFPDEFVPTLNGYVAGTDAAAEFVCDVLVNGCDGGNIFDETASSSSVEKKMDWCLRKFEKLPDDNVIDGLTYIDGNSKGCRVLHSAFAANNPFHCPHITFAAEPDGKGLRKCTKSEGRKPTDLFTEAEIGTFIGIGLILLGYDDTGIRVYENGCPTA